MCAKWLQNIQIISIFVAYENKKQIYLLFTYISEEKCNKNYKKNTQ